MIRKSKWIEVHSPDESVARVAARTLDGRLRLVWHHLPPAAEAGEADDECVHQLRVATRRAVTTLEIFEHLIPKKKARWLRKQLKKLRRAAGAARDYDVLAMRLAERNDEKTLAARKQLLEIIDDHRSQAQEPICEMYANLRKRGYKRRLKRLVTRLRRLDDRHSAEAGRFGDLAVPRMREHVDEFFNCAQQDLHDIEKLHAFRVCGKHLRYSMEVFAGAFRTSFRNELYPQIEALQEQLGKINDHANAQRQYEKWLSSLNDDRLGDLLSQLVREEIDQTRALQDDFLKVWNPERIADLKQSFLDELSVAS
jgi:CHAD domain-containing protein